MRRSLRTGNRLPHMITREDLDFFFMIQGPDVVALAGNNTTIRVEKHGSGVPIVAGGAWTYTMRYYATDVVSWYPDGTVTLRADRRETLSTKRRMNLALVPLGWKLYQCDFHWYLWRIGDETGPDLPFRNGMIVAHAYNGSEYNR